eukprot:108654-Pleurochrysis_carterae.AAC.3
MNARKGRPGRRGDVQARQKGEAQEREGNPEEEKAESECQYLAAAAGFADDASSEGRGIRTSSLLGNARRCRGAQRDESHPARDLVDDLCRHLLRVRTVLHQLVEQFAALRRQAEPITLARQKEGRVGVFVLRMCSKVDLSTTINTGVRAGDTRSARAGQPATC